MSSEKKCQKVIYIFGVQSYQIRKAISSFWFFLLSRFLTAEVNYAFPVIVLRLTGSPPFHSWDKWHLLTHHAAILSPRHWFLNWTEWNKLEGFGNVRTLVLNWETKVKVKEEILDKFHSVYVPIFNCQQKRQEKKRDEWVGQDQLSAPNWPVVQRACLNTWMIRPCIEFVEHALMCFWEMALQHHLLMIAIWYPAAGHTCWPS